MSVENSGFVAVRKPEILFLQVGGTVDKDYPQGETDHGYGFHIGDPAFLSILDRANLAYHWSQGYVVRKDSLDMIEDDRVAVRARVTESYQEHIVITHGTDTIYETAEMLGTIPDKTIVLTGAMLPEKFRDSDADFNLGMAVAAVQCLPHGVYVALNGKVEQFVLGRF